MNIWKLQVGKATTSSTGYQKLELFSNAGKVQERYKIAPALKENGIPGAKQNPPVGGMESAD